MMHTIKTVTAAGAVLVGFLIWTGILRPGPMTPVLVIGIIACALVADVAEVLADRKADRDGGEPE